jgi:hypothetical protein
MAAYSRDLLAPYVAKIEAQAERLGRLEAELEAARARVAELEAPPPPETRDGAAPEPLGGRPWWRRAWAWLNEPQAPA